MTHQKNSIVVAYSNYNLEELQELAHTVQPCTCNPCTLLNLIEMAKNHGYRLKFITNWFRKTFKENKYKIIGVIEGVK